MKVISSNFHRFTTTHPKTECQNVATSTEGTEQSFVMNVESKAGLCMYKIEALVISLHKQISFYSATNTNVAKKHYTNQKIGRTTCRGRGM